MRKFILAILIIFISAFALNAQEHDGVSAVLPPIIRVASAPVNLRPFVFRQIHSMLLNDAHGHQLRPAKEVMRQLSNRGTGVLYSYTPEQYRDIAYRLNANSLYQAEIYEFQLQTALYREPQGNVTHTQYRLHINIALNRIDAKDGTPQRLGQLAKDYDSDNRTLFPPAKTPSPINLFRNCAITSAIHELIENIEKNTDISR